MSTARRPNARALAVVIALITVWVITLAALWALYASEEAASLELGFCASFNDGPMRCGKEYYDWAVGTYPLRLGLPLGLMIVLLSPLGCALEQLLSNRCGVVLHLGAFSLLGLTIGGLWWWSPFGQWVTPGGAAFPLIAAGAVGAGWAVARRTSTTGKRRTS